MIVLNGKYNHAKVMIDHVDAATQTQIIGFLNHPAFAKKPIVIMPDCHAGAGAVVGFTMPLGEHIIPNIVGVDIGCGVYANRLGSVQVDFAAFDAYIREHIPSGHAVHTQKTAVADILPQVLREEIEEVCYRIGENYERTLYSVGTLGGGNHFIELNTDTNGDIWVVVHSGSRHFGLAVANYHQARAKELMIKMFHGASAYNGLEFLPLDIGGAEYLKDMRIAQQFAKFNRFAMMLSLVNGYFDVIPPGSCEVSSVHNYIGDDDIIRKGAISAEADQRVIIPLNMRDGAILGVGLGNASWNNSAPHGAGRKFSRRRAKDELSLKEYAKEMDGIWSSCISEKTLDESPMAYKDTSDVLDNIAETVKITDKLIPIYNFKAD